MKTKTILIGIAVFFYTFFHISSARAETFLPIIISEIQITGTAGRATDDFIELYNPNPAPIDLSGYRLRYRNSSGTENSLNKIGNDLCIAAHGYFLWANSGGAFANIADTKTGTGLSSKYSLALLLPENSEHPLIDSVSWENSHPFDASSFIFPGSPGADESMVRDIATGDWLPDFSLTPTPTKSTSTICPAPELTPDQAPAPTKPPVTSYAIRLNEIFPNPKAKGDVGEFIELYNFGAESADISGWILRDATKTGKYVFPSATVITAGAYLAVTDQSFKLSLNNSNETISLFDNASALIDSVRYEKTKEDVSLNHTAGGWRGGAPTPGTVNRINNLPETKEKVPKKGYKKVPVTFSAKGKDADRQKLKYTWNFGDGSKSYKAETSHTYETNGTYTVTLTTTDGVEDTVETFAIEIRSYKPPEVRIISLVPNPAGSDTDNEWIIIENREKKTINLKGFGIATGWKNIVNHPVREDFIIEPKQTRKMTRAESLFTLPNQKGKIELRAPDGKVLQKIRYKLEKSAAEDSVYTKEKGKRWEWQTEQMAEGDQQTTEMSALPDPLKTDLGDILPEEEALPVEEDENSEKEVLGAEVSRPDNYDAFIRLLGTGTGVEVPDDITLAFDEISDEAAELPLEEHYAVSFAKESLSLFNATLNDLFASVR